MTPQHCIYSAVLVFLQSLNCIYVAKFKLLQNTRKFVTEVNCIVSVLVYLLEIAHFVFAILKLDVDFLRIIPRSVRKIEQTNEPGTVGTFNPVVPPLVHTSAQIILTFVFLGLLLLLSLVCTLQTTRLLRFERKLSSISNILMNYHSKIETLL